ncbi:unnamed protein product [Acanthoscelides obtectus]|uniref:RETREG1-3/ARL6IP-like N-terminal reticulon-homology domain-containing protein n=1 Tax=Acanthoscelides obtectus TaxID=200917 RepID=A0A9P0L140_ACAOB|nr:unnamed protein product [Acanthoscelides obtectus]CAK1670693.1 hypothetical protein AOBTE_LOCUS27768 [Acanthoscelides obtectus]
MQYIRSKFTNFTSYFVKRVEENEGRKISKCDICCEQIYKVLNWENPKQTLTVFLVTLFLFWIVVQLQIKFFGMLFFGLLIAFLLDAYYDTKDLTNHSLEHIEAFEKFHHLIQDVVLNLRAIRKESPSSFCIGMSLIFLVMTVIANSMSGYMLTYLTILAIFFLPLGFKCLPEEHVGTLKILCRSILNPRGHVAEEELIPFICNKDFANRDNDDVDSLLTDKTADSASNSLISGLSQMPSYLDVAEIQNDIEEEDLIPHTSSAVSFTPGELSSDSDSERRDIHFEAAHFNGDSSSEEEKLMGRDLRFAAIEEVIADGAKEQGGIGGMLGSIVSTVSSNLVGNILKSNAPQAQIERKNSSSDSEFEIINTEDVKE